jgi:hypothetical protein
MKRQRQCSTWSSFEIDVRCQRLAQHDGPHKASTGPTAGGHWSWTDANPKNVELLPGTVWFHRPDPCRVAATARLWGAWSVIGLVALVL